MQSKAATVEQYLEQLPEDRREAIQAVREVILRNLDREYEEGMQYGMIGYYVPHRIFPAGYHCDPKQPLPFAGLAAQKNHMAVYLMALYGHSPTESWFREAWARAGKKLDMGKCCVRFKKLDDVPLDVLGEVIRRVPAKKYIEQYESLMRTMNTRASGAAAKKNSAAGRASARGKPNAATRVVTKKTGPKKVSNAKSAARKSQSTRK